MKTPLHLNSVIILSGFMIFCNSFQSGAQLIYEEGRVLINPESALILPVKPTLCPNSDGVELIANVQDLDNRFVYLWSGPSNEGVKSKIIFATEPGLYSVSVWDDKSNPITVLTTTVYKSGEVSTADAGVNQTLCFDSELHVDLDAQTYGPSTWTWQGGDGVFVNGRNDLRGIYLPSESEIEQGYVKLTLAPSGADGCDASASELEILFPTFDSNASVFINHASSDNSYDASIEFSFVGGALPLSYQWSNGAISPYVSNLGVGTYQLKITDANGCEAWSNVTINVNDFVK